MGEVISEALFERLRGELVRRLGLDFQRDRWKDLERGISAAAGELGFKDAASCADWLVSSSLTREEVEILAGHLTIGETYFFRDRRSLDALAGHILPGLIQSRRKSGRYLRIWSAGCCTGEEPYTIAMLLDGLIPDLKDWNISILATDINCRFLRRASQGVYREWSFRNAPGWLKGKYFRAGKEGHYEILPSIKERVAFSYLNLADEVYPSVLNNTNAMDVIFCRNVLMYFDKGRVKKVIEGLSRSLVEGGWLLVGAGEVSHTPCAPLQAVRFPGATFYEKGEHRDQVAEVAAQPMAEQKPPPVVFEPAAAGEENGFDSWKNSDASPPQVHEPDAYQAALALYDQGRYAESSEKISGWLLEHSHHAPAMVLLARSLANQGKLGEAGEWCRKAVEIDRLNADWHYFLAVILAEQNRLEEASSSLRRVLYLDPDFVVAHFALGNLARRRGRTDESVKYFKNTVALLKAYRDDKVLLESGGMTAGALRELIQSAPIADDERVKT